MVDFFEASVNNSYGDMLETQVQNPTKEEVVRFTVQALELLGYSPRQIYDALFDEAEHIKNTILFSKSQKS